MRHTTPHRWLLRLALAATMLMVVLPSMGRLAGNGPATHAAHAMHAAAQGAHVAHAKGPHGAPAAPVAPQPAGSTQYDCGYCPLLASLVPSAAVAPSFGTLLHDALAARAVDAPRMAWRHPWGLGSRGPPAA